jgi:hypothetical protein
LQALAPAQAKNGDASEISRPVHPHSQRAYDGENNDLAANVVTSPWRFGVDASDEFLVVDEGIKEIAPCVGGTTSIGKHLPQFSYSIVG